jgi:hypothetical protein
MTDTDIHSCGYYCDRPACIVAQRNELRDKLFGERWVKTYSGGKPNYTQPIEKEWVGLTLQEIDYIEGMTLDKHDAIRMAAVALQEKNGG